MTVSDITTYEIQASDILQDAFIMSWVEPLL